LPSNSIAARAASIGSILVELRRVEVETEFGVLVFCDCRASRIAGCTGTVTCTLAQRTDRRGAQQNFKTPDAPQTSTRNNSTTMALIDDAIAAIKLRERGEHFSYQAIADEFGMQRSTLSQRRRSCQGCQDSQKTNQLLLSPQQELSLIKYIKDLTEQGLPPTQDMIRDFASDICHNHIGNGWVTRFLHRNHGHLISQWTTRIDCTCHNADSTAKYELYFGLLHGKIEEYGVLPTNMYNMDEKGVMIGVTGHSKRVFSRHQ
jgi:hypothetical protein